MRKTTLAFGLLFLMAVSAIAGTAQTAALALTDPKWNLIEINGVAVKDSKAYLRFDTVKKHSYYGSSSCNFLGGNYRVDGPNLTFSESFVTRRNCQDPEVEKVQQEFLKVLYSTTRFWIYEDQLRLYNGDQLTLVFKAGPVPKSN